MKVSIKKATLSLGILFALIHFLWVTLIAIAGKPVVDYLLGLHFISGFTVTPFSFNSALIGVLGAFVCGVIVGAILAFIWNNLD